MWRRLHRGVRSSQLAGREEESPALRLEIQTLAAALRVVCVQDVCERGGFRQAFQSLDYHVKIRKDRVT